MLRLALGGNGKERRRSRKEISETNLRYLTAVFASSARVGVELEVFIFCFVLFVLFPGTNGGVYVPG